jgi:hypothetical protein
MNCLERMNLGLATAVTLSGMLLEPAGAQQVTGAPGSP